MASNRGVAYMGTGKVEIQTIDYPGLTLGTSQMQPWRDREDCRHQHLRQRPAYGAGSDDRPDWPDPGP